MKTIRSDLMTFALSQYRCVDKNGRYAADYRRGYTDAMTSIMARIGCSDVLQNEVLRDQIQDAMLNDGRFVDFLHDTGFDTMDEFTNLTAQEQLDYWSSFACTPVE